MLALRAMGAAEVDYLVPNRFEFGYGLRAGQGAAFEDGFTQADETFIGVNLEKEPARFDKERFKLGDLHETNLLP